MTTEPPSPPRRYTDLVAFLAVLVTGIVLVAFGVPATSLAAVAMALAALYSAWRSGHRPGPPPRDRGSSSEDDDSPVG
ncbi:MULTISPECIES: hypothetical protein [unclassified Embleya]|uniref:hypothetical protein n=1 Tax=unclassified Embleya TaxID=2699296 RepID=UPI0033CFAEC7